MLIVYFAPELADWLGVTNHWDVNRTPGGEVRLVICLRTFTLQIDWPICLVLRSQITPAIILNYERTPDNSNSQWVALYHFKSKRNDLSLFTWPLTFFVDNSHFSSHCASPKLISCLTFTLDIPQCSSTCVSTIWSVISILKAILRILNVVWCSGIHCRDSTAYTRLDLTYYCSIWTTAVTYLGGLDTRPYFFWLWSVVTVVHMDWSE